MKVNMSGTRGGADWPRAGEVLEVDDEEGAQLCLAGIAMPVVEDKTEAAEPPQPEKRGPGRPART